MKKVFVLALLVITLLVGCKKGNEKTIVIGASSTPHAVILEYVKPKLKELGYDLKIKVYDDYILPNKALSEGSLDANYFQHRPYLNSYNKQNRTNLVSLGLIHYEPFGIYGKGITSLNDLRQGAKIIIPADDSNETRALLLLVQEGLITLSPNKTVETGITTLDILDNRGFEVVAVQADTVTSQLNNSNDGTIAVVNGNYAIQAGLSVSNSLALEDATGDAAQTYANIIAIRSGEENSDKLLALLSVLQTEDVKNFINQEFGGAVKPIF